MSHRQRQQCGRASSRRAEHTPAPRPTGVKGAGATGGPGCGARGRWRGLGGLRDDGPSNTSVTRPHRCGGPGGHGLRRPWAVARPGRASKRHTEPHISNQAPLVWRAPEGPEGTGGLRDRPLRAFRLACGDLAGGRARRRPEHQRHHEQHNDRHHTNTPRHTKNRHPDRTSACGGAQGACVELVPTRDHLLLVAMAA